MGEVTDFPTDLQAQGVRVTAQEPDAAALSDAQMLELADPLALAVDASFRAMKISLATLGGVMEITPSLAARAGLILSGGEAMVIRLSVWRSNPDELLFNFSPSTTFRALVSDVMAGTYTQVGAKPGGHGWPIFYRLPHRRRAGAQAKGRAA